MSSGSLRAGGFLPRLLPPPTEKDHMPMLDLNAMRSASWFRALSEDQRLAVTTFASAAGTCDGDGNDLSPFDLDTYEARLGTPRLTETAVERASLRAALNQYHRARVETAMDALARGDALALSGMHQDAFATFTPRDQLRIVGIVSRLTERSNVTGFLASCVFPLMHRLSGEAGARVSASRRVEYEALFRALPRSEAIDMLAQVDQSEVELRVLATAIAVDESDVAGQRQTLESLVGVRRLELRAEREARAQREEAETRRLLAEPRATPAEQRDELIDVFVNTYVLTRVLATFL